MAPTTQSSRRRRRSVVRAGRLLVGFCASILVCSLALRRDTRLVLSSSASCGGGGGGAPDPNHPATPIDVDENSTIPVVAAAEISLARRRRTTTTTTNSSKARVVHHARFGLGHRLGKITSAWHLTKSLNLTGMNLHWRDCSGAGNVFEKLFGSDRIDDYEGGDPEILRMATAEEEEAAATDDAVVENNDDDDWGGESIQVINDVSGYYGGHNFKIHRIPLPPKFRDRHDSPFLEKLDSDLQLYKILRGRFAGRDEATRFMDEHNFDDHLVIGLHLRLGNDEPAHFKSSGREVQDQLSFVYNVVDLIKLMLEEMEVTHPERFLASSGGGDGCPRGQRRKEPLLFLATDSPKFIPVIANDTAFFGVKTVVMPQIRLDEGATFYKLTVGNKCVQGWKDMFLDNFILGSSDVLVAARHSSFTQNLPMSLVFDRGGNGPRFCEASNTGNTMTCLEDIGTWLFRDDPTKIFTYAHPGENEGPVVHSLHVHLPDVVRSDQYAKAVEFLDATTSGTSSTSKTMRYGSEFDPKYRIKVACPHCTEFNFAVNGDT